MAQPWPTSAPTLRIAPVSGTGTSPSLPATPAPASTAERGATDRALTLARVRELVLRPATALVVMLLGLVLLFVWPVVGLPFVGLVVLPTVVYHLRAEQRVRLRRTQR